MHSLHSTAIFAIEFRASTAVCKHMAPLATFALLAPARFPLQVRAGTGGEEAALWAADLIRMYQKYADSQGWKVSLVNESTAEAGGYKECILQVGLLLCQGFGSVSVGLAHAGDRKPCAVQAGCCGGLCWVLGSGCDTCAGVCHPGQGGIVHVRV